MVQINPERVLHDLYFLREIGKYKTGVHRPTLSPDDMTTRHWLCDQLKAIGHEAHIDGIANVIGRSPATGAKLLAGSHLESQNHAGWLDGALGMIYALEAARVMAADEATAGTGVDVIAFADEEGHFGDLLGSRSYTGQLTEAEIEAAANATDGTPLRRALKDAGLEGIPRVEIEPGRHVGFLEAHIEQGDWLEANNLQIGIVTSVVAIWEYKIVFEGIQNHAGTTRMAIRRDAGAALVRLVHEISERFPKVAGERSVWTTGRIELEPGASSIIPGRAEMLFQLRDADPAILDRMDAELRRLVDEADKTGPCKVTLEQTAKGEPAVMAPAVQDEIEAAAEHHAPGRHTRMPSGASHDAQVIATRLPAGMIFIPSIGGISHHYAEDSTDEDIVLGAQVYATAAAGLLKAG